MTNRVAGILTTMEHWLATVETHPLQEFKLDRDAVRQLVAVLKAPAVEPPAPQYSCVFPGCPGTHISKWMVCESEESKAAEAQCETWCGRDCRFHGCAIARGLRRTPENREAKP
jgi:hypothetical protein